MYLPKNKDGVGLQDLRVLNKASLLKFAWDSFQSDIFWSRYFKVRYKVHSYFSAYKVFRSSLTGGFNFVLPVFYHGSRWLIGDGKQVSFWKVKWLDFSISDILDLAKLLSYLSNLVSSVIKIVIGTFLQSLFNSFQIWI